MKREKGTYTLVDNPVMAYTKRHHDASAGVLVTLAERDNLTHLPAEMKVAEIMLETDLGQRGVEKCLNRLEAAGLAARSANGWTYSGANCRANRLTNRKANSTTNERANQDANERANDGSLNKIENTDQDDKDKPLKELEGIEKELKDKNTPLTPQGVQTPEIQNPAPLENQGGTANPVQVAQGSQDAKPGQAADKEDVPRRRAAPPDLPDDLAAVPGMPEAWQKWLKYAREVRLKITESVADAQFQKLRKLRADGWELPYIVQHAIETSWKSFYEIRGEKPRQNLKLPPPKAEKPRTREEWLS